MALKQLRIGTRASQLALWQANWVKSELEQRYPGMEVSLVKIKTIGDKILDVPLAQVGGKGLFVKEIEEAMLRGDIDIAVHSMKDVPTEFPEGLGLHCITEREDPRDAVISRGTKFADLPQGAKIGTSALRRQAQLLKVRPDMEMVIIRGNVETRINKLETEKLDAVILAAAGLKRLGFTEKVAEYLPTDLSIPAIGQGALGIECRLDNEEVKQTIDFFNHPATAYAVRAERALLWRCEGGCQVPIAAFGEVTGSDLKLVGFIASVDGKTSVRGTITGPAADCEKLGIKLAEQLLADGGHAILAEVYQREVSREKEIPV
ncbi:hydroxymethylbilane synthase [Geotalea daltonii FRC-32]|uniref:Porphobilinogen deaminase n=1 Tax=Geotalea daltonii (strain DSM 22248 / JCM 15807 / FRC-32) TaxID=316067 RepID=HEM3_GEODF|nr:hydroxymethylbilane synthase [Geotalea daltonii]B9M416.1 RecName: Full=Porphobilinogen deaminase; Short=PBG; AltName: Full=Hydroxymethylbilane synthase; Short=HMBS; AltName: Full=Pre-uroporphyrinogen synthase [Geotalea daltonii FRC-32]ACM19659.1 hydroxymethylbilane synthase [Geotalea daltonii FRC-32]